MTPHVAECGSIMMLEAQHGCKVPESHMEHAEVAKSK